MENTVDQTKLAESVSENIKYNFIRAFLVKPLELDKVNKEISRPIDTNDTVEDGMEIKDYKDVVTETKEVDSDFRKGIVIKVPYEYRTVVGDYKPFEINIGDTIVYRNGAGKYFDLVKDSQLVVPYDIVAVIK